MSPHRLAPAVAGLIGLALASAAHAEWVTSWGASAQAPSPARGAFPASPSFKDQTLRQVVRLSAGGRAVRLRLSNAYGTAPLTVANVHVDVAGAGGAVQAGTDRPVTFGGAASIIIAPGAEVLSDPAPIDVPALTSLAVSLYLPADTGPCTCHGLAMQTGYVASGDVSAAPVLEQTAPLAGRAFLSGVDVDAAPPAAAIVAFGDSITDGLGSTADRNRRWPDVLAERLAARGGGAWGVVNEGISGNRLLHDGAGDSALKRFDRDVLGAAGARYLVVFEGVNDLGLASLPPEMAARFGMTGDPVTADQLIGADKQIIARAHARGLKVYGATIAPYKGAGYWSPAGEAMRAAVNAWIRTGGAFDGVIDFDAVLRDPADPEQMRADYNAGDHLHGSDAGYKAMADSIDLGLFQAASR